MASSSSNRKKSGGQPNVPCWFQAVIHPYKEEIFLCPLFMKKYSADLDFNKYGWILNTKRESTMVVFKFKDGRAYLSDGTVVAKRNDFKYQRTVLLYFTGVHNRFYMYPARISPTTNLLMPPPPLDHDPRSWSEYPPKNFKTTIYPNKARIHVCPYFMRSFGSIINTLKPVLIKYHNNIEYSALLHGHDDEWYLHYGFFAAKKFGFQVPTTVYLDFQLHDNRFNMSDSKPNSIVNPAAENIIVVSSDSDETDQDGNNDQQSSDEESTDDEDDGSNDDENTDQTGGESDDGVSMDDEDADLYEFDVIVTESLAYTNQVMHFPNRTSKHVLGNKQSFIYLRDLDTAYFKKCTIKTSNRNPNEKYLGAGWYDFKVFKELRPNDVLHFQVEQPPKYMNVKVVRAPTPSR